MDRASRETVRHARDIYARLKTENKQGSQTLDPRLNTGSWIPLLVTHHHPGIYTSLFDEYGGGSECS